MRKSTLVILSAALLLLAVICTAGCVTDEMATWGSVGSAAADRAAAASVCIVFFMTVLL